MSHDPGPYQLLMNIDGPRDVRRLRRDQLGQLCQEVRRFLIESVARTSGHFASGLGVVELTVAVHYVFSTPEDMVVWDVGHQAYPHKILTGSRDRLGSIRQKGGLHAFIWRGETECDLLTTGHASTSIGSALGLAVAQKARHTGRDVVAIIGDGALSGGMAFEALNHAGSFRDLNLLVILNDNEMSISENVGYLAQGLSHLLATPHYGKFIQGGKQILKKLPALKDFAMRAQEHFKGMIMPGTLFEEFGFNYIGPIDGHDIGSLVTILQNLRELGGLQFLHVVTKKGKGYRPAELDPVFYHGVGKFDPRQGAKSTSGKDGAGRNFSDAFGRWICELAAADPDVVGITPAMRLGSSLTEFARRFPERFFDVAIAEQHSLVFASGLAAGGLRPVVAIYSSFLQRGYDSVIHDVAIQDLPIVLAIDRAGVVGPDGPTHQGAYDIAYLRLIPNLTLMAPSTLRELHLMLNTAHALGHPAAVRYPRAEGLEDCDGLSTSEVLEVGRGRVLHRGRGTVVFAFGTLAWEISGECERRGITLCDMRFVKPLDEQLILEMAAAHEQVVTLEEGVVCGGVGEEVLRLLGEHRIFRPCLTLGLPDRFIMEGTRDEILEELGLSGPRIMQAIARLQEQGTGHGCSTA